MGTGFGVYKGLVVVVKRECGCLKGGVWCDWRVGISNLCSRKSFAMVYVFRGFWLRGFLMIRVTLFDRG